MHSADLFSIEPARDRTIDQYFTPAWAAELLVKRHFPELHSGDVLVDPTCGDGRFLMAVPGHVDCYGVEIDPAVSIEARANSGREVVVGNFIDAKLPRRPTGLIGNPPFSTALVDQILDRAYEELEYGGKAGFILPAFYFQTASHVMKLAKKWSIAPEFLPRNLFQDLAKPIVFGMFLKERKPILCGMFLYAELHALESLRKQYRQLFVGNGARANVWREAVAAALHFCGGTASLNEIYSCMENNRPTDNQCWREKIRQTLARYFRKCEPGVFAL